MRRMNTADFSVEGQAGMSALGPVLLVREVSTGKLLVGKPMPAGADDRELSLLARLRHPNVVALEGVAEDADRSYLLLRYAERGDLRTYLASAGAAAVPRLLADALRGLAFLHARRVVHGDLTPANLLVFEDGTLAVADLGLARAAGAAESGGTLAFMAPERWTGQPSSPSSDLYGLVASFAVALGAPLSATATGGPGHYAAFLEGVPELASLLPLLTSMLGEKADSRPPSAGAALRHLAQLTGDPALAQETEASARAWLRPFSFVGRAGLLEAVVGAGVGVTRLRAPPGFGATRLLEEAALARRTSLLQAGALRDPSLLEGQELLLLDDGEQLPEPLVERLVEIHRLAMDGGMAPRVMVVVRPEQSLDERLRAEGSPSIDLPALDAESVFALVREVFPFRGGVDALAAALHDRCGGAPGRILSVIAALHARTLVVPGTIVLEDLPEPEQLLTQDVLASACSSHVASLSSLLNREAEVRRLAALAACARRSLSWLVARRAFSDGSAGEDAFAEAVRRLAEAGALAETDHFRVPGASVKEALLSLLSAEEQREAHRSLAKALFEEGGEDPLLLSADRHWHRVSSGEGEVDGVVEIAGALLERGLARESLQLLSLFESLPPAGELLRARAQAMCGDCGPALATARGAADKGLPGAARLVVEILMRLGEYRQAISETNASVGSADAGLLALRARALVLSGDYPGALSVCESSQRLGPRGGEASDIEATAALAHFYQGDLQGAIRHYCRSAEMARETQDAAREANAINGLGLVAQRRGAFDEARDRYAEALALAEASGDRARQGTCHLNLGTVLQELGRTREAAAAYRRSARIARLIGERVQSARARSNLANLLIQLGHLEEGKKVAAEAEELARASGARVVAAYALLLVGEAALWSGDEGSAEHGLRAAQADFSALGNAAESVEGLLLLARLALQKGDYAGAGEQALEARRVARGRSLERHESQANLILAESALEGRAVAAEVLAHAFAALSLALRTNRPDLLWRIEAVIARGADDDAARRHHASRALRLMNEAAAGVDTEDREAFLARPDRARTRTLLLAIAPEGSFAHDPRLSRLLSINRRLGAERSLKSLLDGIVDEAVSLCGAERGFVLLAGDRPGAGFSVAVARNIDGETIARGQMKVSHSIAARVIERGEPELTLDAQEDERYLGQQSVAALRLRSVVCVPLRFQGRVLGALYIDNRFRARAFGEADLELLEAFAGQAAIGLAQVRALEDARLAREEAEKARSEVEALNLQLQERMKSQEAELTRARREAEEQRRLVAHTGRFAEIVGESPPMRTLLRQMERVAETDLSVLVTGESGTGKELVARALYSHGPRRERAFVSINCGALAEGLLESELFGHVRGAFTGADRDKDGLFEVAHGGTLFLDEVGDMGPSMQVKLLRALQEGEVRRVGGRQPVKVDVRIIAATNRDLTRMMREGSFREDLYYRLNVVALHLPPLRERREDLPALCARLLGELPPRESRPFRLAPESLTLLSRYPWPGNIRELRATLHNAALFAESDLLLPADFAHKPELTRQQPLHSGGSDLAGRSIDEIEAEAIRRTLELTGGNKSETARLLGIDRKTLYNKLSRLRIDAA